MKVYIDGELPKNCEECSLHRSGKLKMQRGARYIDAETCVLGNFYKFQEIDDEIDTCPLETTQSLKQQVRKEVIEQIKDYMERHSHTIPIDTKNRKVIYKIGLTRFLDQVKGENNEIF